MTLFRILRHAAVLALIAAATASQAMAGPPELEAIVAERAAAHGVNPAYLIAVAGCESGWDPFAVGAAGELGLMQLLPGRGMLAVFYSWGYDEVWSAWQQADFAARAFAYGLGWNWSCA